MKKSHRIAPEVKEQILRRIKNEGVSVSQAAKRSTGSQKPPFTAGWGKG
jgi:hypothetical protein